MRRIDRPLRVAIAGAGFASGMHLAGWSRLRDVDVVAICDPDREKAQVRAREHGIAGVFDDAREMLDSTRPHALDIAAPLDVHVALCRLAAERGIHVLCQKPLAPTVPQALELAKATHARIRLMVHENWRFRPHYREIERWLQDGTIGRPRYATMQVRSSALVADEDGALPLLRRQPSLRRLDRFMIGEVLVHHLDVLRWLLGPLDVVAARTARHCAGIEGESGALVLLEGREVLVTLGGDFTDREAPARTCDRLEVVGSAGVLTLERNVVRARGAHPRSATFDLDAGYADSYAGAIAHFADSLATGAPFETDVRDNLHTLALVDAAYARAQIAQSRVAQ
ncbi:MAG TPA: Gfo/Idh/MocA family oxidoreductase [Casimicrobiaceae bacterium]|jgi:predicted dehydrogenase|nr:Gfo/Idh/MocA family oxidoreductase [Casimicrobiaceae bacterium]